ncbi:acyltransferase [Aliidiomarina sedimenti]|uniref:Acyltransferase n=1 Tax=Aliidiomarina sedimenti TaxID=1933879 RepID=A0ABY0BYF1_9GAMM|nr:acyltransferase family protein [Aliidiomarina sedimenti]RUO29784.1 acyltransferase [Aliidiomarina sedimenti]
MQFLIEKSGFRNDINGLRAWAVISVVLFHFLVPGFSGGFVGVDIFFVISGFLMTGIITQGLVEQKFSFSRFYLARAVRIVPALVVLVLSLLVWAWFYLPTPDYQGLAGHARYALVFWSNVEFASADSYFAANSHENWLLHTWSLSVEWQFYILFPLLLVLIAKFTNARLHVLFYSLIALVVLSLSYSIWLSPREPTAAFYLLSTRAWEMAAGGVAYFVYVSNWRRVVERPLTLYTGWLLLGLSFTTLNSDLSWPGAWALLPVVGTVLVLLANQSQSILTKPRLFQWLGDRSYSIYLWHWPFAVWLYYIGQLGNPWYLAVGIAVSILAGHLSYWWVEQPVRRSFKELSGRLRFVAVMVPLVMVLAMSLVIRNVVFDGRMPTEVERIAAEAENRNPRGDACRQSMSELHEPCIYGGERLGAIVIGDSHAAALVRSVEAALPNDGLHVLDWTMSACPTIRNLRHSQRHSSRFLCPEFVDYAIEQSSQLPPEVPLLVVNRISNYLHGEPQKQEPEIYLSEPAATYTVERAQELISGFKDTVCTFAQHRPVYVLEPVAEMPVDVPEFMSRKLHFNGEIERVSISISEYEQRHKLALEAMHELTVECNVKLLAPTAVLCDEENCWGDKDGLPVYFDDDHLNERGGRLLLTEFRKMFSDASSDESADGNEE